MLKGCTRGLLLKHVAKKKSIFHYHGCSVPWAIRLLRVEPQTPLWCSQTQPGHIPAATGHLHEPQALQVSITLSPHNSSPCHSSQHSHSDLCLAEPTPCSCCLHRDVPRAEGTSLYHKELLTPATQSTFSTCRWVLNPRTWHGTWAAAANLIPALSLLESCQIKSCRIYTRVLAGTDFNSE